MSIIHFSDLIFFFLLLFTIIAWLYYYSFQNTPVSYFICVRHAGRRLPTGHNIFNIISSSPSFNRDRMHLLYTYNAFQ